MSINAQMTEAHHLEWIEAQKREAVEQAAPELLTLLEFAAARVTLANEEGDPILLAWLPEARAAIAKARGDG